MSLRSTINWLITLVMLLFMLSLTALQIAAARRSIDAEMQAATLITQQMLGNLVASDSVGGGTQPQMLIDFLGQAGRIRAHDIEVRGSGGDILYASPPSPYKSGRSAPDWFSTLVAPQ
ncbi:MAG TPA: hypothetical protein VGE69_11710, partial [Pseudomonadales bacterium]